MSARDNLNSALTALEASAASVDQAVTTNIANHVDVLGSGEVQAAADKIFTIVATLQGAAQKLSG